MSLSVIKGAKAGQEKPHQPSIAKDDVASISKVKILYALSEGEVKGLVNGPASIMLDGTPLLDADGNPNFENVEWEIRNGTVDQTHIAGLPSLSSEIGIGTILRSGTPWIRTITNTQLSSANVNVSWSRLSETTDKFDVIGTKVDYAIDVQTDGNGYVTVLDTSIKAKTSGRYQRTHNIKLPEAQQGWQIRVRKITADGDNERKFNQMQIDSIAEIIDAKLRYPHTALLYLSFDARAFSNIPKMTVDMYGRYLKVPVNYDPVSRTSAGIWTGEFKTDYTNNPAWVYYDLITNDRYGLGDRLKPFMINKWAIAHIARICDEPVSDGKGGTEPRFTCNLYLQVAEQAYQVLQHIAAIFRGMSFWDGAQIVLDADTPRDADYVITRANVVDGAFVKSGTAIDDRHTLVQVAWSNPDNNYETDYVTVRNERAIAKYGINPLDMPVVGCTSEGQAYRAGLAALLSEQNRTQTVSFAMGLDGSLPSVGSRVDIADMMFTGANNGGRISAVNANYTVITVDRDDIPAKAGDRLSVNLESGRAQTREILSVSGRNITVKAAFDPVAAENVWAVDSDELPTMPFIVLSITENEDRTQYTYTALQYDAGLYAQIDNGTIIEPRPPVPPMNPYIIQAPDSVTVSSRNRVVQAQNVTTFVIVWDQVKDAVAYDVEWRKDDGDWIKLPRTGNISAEIDGVYSGNYLARVRAVSAFDAISKPTTSMLTAITGKAGKPPKLLSIKATGLLFGMQLDWTFAPGSGDTAYTEIQVASAPDVNVATLGQFAFNTDTHTVNGLQGGLTQHYRGRIVDKLGNTSDWTSWVSGTTDISADKVLDLIQGQINKGSLNDILTSEIEDIKINKDAISKETNDRIQAIIDANKRITDEAEDRVEALRLAALRTDGLQNFADDLANDVDTVTLAQAQTANGLAVVKERADAFEIENGLQAQRLTYLSSEIDSGYTDATKYTDKSRGTVWTFAKAVAHADYVNAQSIQGLSADYQNSSARFTEEINLLTTKNEAVATKTTNLSAQMVGGYDGNDLTKLNSGLLFEESKARATDVEGLAEQISLLSAGVGEQFDSFEIWHFNKDKDGWTGGTYNSGGWLNVRAETITSPNITDLDGAVYKHIKLRIKKVGTPTWQGLLSYTGDSKTVTEPSYDADGIALVNWQLEWTGDITSFSLKLASAGDNLNYYSIDWIAVGRPSPGASNASLLRESKVRASETSANASDLVDLRSKIEGGNGVPIESSITKKLETTANLASTTAEEVSTLKSTYDDDMYGYEGTVQTTARTLASATQAEAERLDLLSANVLPSYTDATKYTDAKRSTQWTYAKTVAADNYAANQRITNLQSDFDNSTSNINKELFTLTEKDKSIAVDITQLYAETGANYGLIQDVSLAISTPNTGLAAKVTELQTSAQENAEAASAAADAAANAAEAAGNKGEVIYSATEPSVDKQRAQNLWIDTTGGKNTPKRWAAGAWLTVTDKAATDAAQAASDAMVAAQDKGEIIYSNTAPAVPKRLPQNLWIDTTNSKNTPKRWDTTTSTWVVVTDKVATDAATAAAAKGEVIFSDTAPTTDKRLAQNLWIDTAGGKNTPKRWNGTAWEVVTDKVATDAASVASEARGKLSDISADNKLTPVEKKQTKLIVDEIKQADSDMRARAAKYSVSDTAYVNAYNALVSYIDPKLLDLNATDTIDRTTFNARFNSLYGARATLDTAINAAAKDATDAVDRKLEPANLASLVEGSGAFSDEFGSIAGQFANFEAVVEGQKTAMEVISGIGNAEKLKNEIAKARLDKNVTNLNAQSTALTNQINSYTAKIAELTTKRNAPKPSDMTQEQYLSLKAEYQKQIDDITAAKDDLIAQKAVIADQVAQLAAEKKVLDDFKETQSNILAQHTVKMNSHGFATGFGLVLDKTGFSEFGVDSDSFYIGAPDGTMTKTFVHYSTSQNINGVVVPIGTYLRDAYIANGTITNAKIANAAITSAKIDNLAVTTGKIANLAVDTLQIKGQAVSVSSAVKKGIRYIGNDENPISAGNVSGKQSVELLDRYLDSGGNPVIMELYFYGTSVQNAGTTNKVTIEFWAGLDMVEQFNFYRSYEELATSFKSIYDGFNGNLRYYAKVYCTSGGRLEAASYLFSVSTLKR